MVTDRAERATQADEPRYRLLFEHMPICIFITDLTATPMSNRGFSRSHGQH